MKNINLFKYYAPKYEGKDNLSFYDKGAFYFQNPAIFNDPWDCKAPQIECPRGQRTLKSIWFKLAEQRGKELAKKAWEEMRNLTRAEKKQLFVKYFENALEEQRSKIGVFSLSFIPDSELMWSHYASSHSGYMLHFQIDLKKYYIDPSRNEINPIPVIYRSTREVLNLEDYYAEKKKYLYDIIRYKSIAWNYECELRFLSLDNSGFIKEPSNWLKSIVTGINTDSGLREKLKNIGNSLNVPVLSSLMNKKEYKIDIPGLKINGNDGRAQYKEVINLKNFSLS